MIDWYFRINPVYPLFLLTIATLLAYMANTKELFILLLIASFFQLCLLLWRKSRESDRETEDLDWDYLYNNIHDGAVRKQLKNRLISVSFFFTLLCAITILLFLFKALLGYLVTGILALLILVRIIKIGYLLLKYNNEQFNN